MNQEKKITFQIATNFDSKLIEQIANYDNFTWVYGKLNKDVIGGGRNSMVLPKLSWDELKEHVDLCHSHNIKFNYLMNSLCLGGMEFNKKFHKKLVKLLNKLTEIQVDAVTVATPYLCEMIKTQYPHFKVTISDYNRISSMQQFLYWQSMGVDEITLFPNFNRDFPMLREMLTLTKGTNLTLRLIANNTCLRECPYHENHGTNNSHSAMKNSFSSSFCIDFQVLKCMNYKIKHPTHFLATEWIRPEDVKYYEQLCEETGNYNLSLKLTDRTKTTEFLSRTAKAYYERDYDGNLFNIINVQTSKDRKQFHFAPFMKTAILGAYNRHSLLKIRGVNHSPELYLDNKKLDGFIEKFVKNYDCTNKICDDEEKSNGEDKSSSNGKCSYCKHWRDKAMKMDKQEVEAWIKLSDSIINDIKDSTILFASKKKQEG